MPGSNSLINSPLLKYFDGTTLRKGSDYWVRNKVLSVEVSKPQTVSASVGGARWNVYTATIKFNQHFDKIISTDCTCPVGEDCKHTAAAVLKFLAQQNQKGATYPGSNGSDLEVAEDEPVDAESEKEKSNKKVLSTTNKGNDSLAGIKSRQDAGAPGIEPQAKAKGSVDQKAQAMKISPETQRHLSRLVWSWRTEHNPFGPSSGAKGTTPPRKNVLLYGLSANPTTYRPHIALFRAAQKKDGSLGTLTEVHRHNLLADVPPGYVSDEDVEIAQLWEVVSAYRKSYWNNLDDSRELFLLLIGKILKTNRAFFISEPAIRIHAAPEKEGQLVWQFFDNSRKVLRLLPTFADNIEDLERLRETHECIPWSTPFYLNKATGAFGVLTVEPPPKLMSDLLQLRINSDETAAVASIFHAENIADIVPPPPSEGQVKEQLIKVTPDLDMEVLTASTGVVVEVNDTMAILAAPREKVKTLILKQSFPRKAGIVRNPDGSVIIEKLDQNSHHIAREKLEELGFARINAYQVNKLDDIYEYYLPLKQDSWTKLEQATSKLREAGWIVSQRLDDTSKPIYITESDIEVEIDEDVQGWWFELALSVVIDGEKVSLYPILYSAAQRLKYDGAPTKAAIETLNQDGYYDAILDDGRTVKLPFDKVRKFLLTLYELVVENPSNKKKVNAVQIQHLIDDEMKLKASNSFIALAQRLRQLQSPPIVDPPREFNGTLRQYQKQGLSWMQFLAEFDLGGIIADDMGLGKTIQILAHICLTKEKGLLDAPFLIVCPTSVLPNWMAEAQRFVPSLNIMSYYGPNRGSVTYKFKEQDIVVSTYPIVQRDSTKLAEHHWHTIVLDESQAIKNDETQIFRAIKELKAKNKICATGTPLQNHLGELWSQFHFLIPPLLGNKDKFKSEYRNPIEKIGDETARHRLVKLVSPFILRRTKKEVVTELPEKSTMIKFVELEGLQRDLYETVRVMTAKNIRQEIESKGFKRASIIVLDALLKLRQVCCDPQLVKLSAARKVTRSVKREALMSMLMELQDEGRKAIVFSQFTSMLDLIHTDLEEMRIPFVRLTGETKDRKTPVEQFQNTDVPFFLISLKAGGVGLNLTAADTVIHYDPWWNPAVEDQATDRAYRIGQDKKVFVYKMIAAGTIEERMMELQEKKRELAECIFDENGGIASWFTEDDLETLLLPLNPE
ncbi:MAG: DEAD/DEAH box helicase [Candidatus Obscuribacterales bacterium]|jgi:superfamily II DNA or RNA helicase|nr:DEAD/DEAH box helicase [Candidatus Obscuribacterales bacterium]